MQNYLWLIPFFPLAGFLCIGLFALRNEGKVAGVALARSTLISFLAALFVAYQSGAGWLAAIGAGAVFALVVGGIIAFLNRLGEKAAGVIAAGAVLASFITGCLAFVELLNLAPESRVFVQTLYRWMATGNFALDISFRLDALSMLMVLVVTGVGFLIHVYSIGYMHGERGFFRFFAFLNLFTFAMLLLVMGNNFLLMFVGWEGVGLCSYLLIGFYYDRMFDESTGMTCAQAGSKAFIVNRIGDFGFLLAVFFIFANFSSLDFDTVFAGAAAGLDPMIASAICLLLFVGATGKSAQIPLYVWLPDAMAGPTPVSALIHAATMVTAGVYMVARCSVFFLQAPLALMVVATIGVLTALFAGTMALTATDIKKVLAYSTVSQLGYMFLACGVGAFAAGVFHLMTHAFFKALLFLGAGSVMHAISGETNIMKMGDLKKHLPITHATMLIASLAIAGVPLLSGFFSKDEILLYAFISPHGSIAFYVLALITAGMTAFYMFRMIYLTFYGTSRVAPEAMNHVHESPKIMTVPLIVLAVLSVIGGYVGVPHVFNKIGEYLHPVFARYTPPGGHEEAHASLGLELGLMALSVLVAVAGIFLARSIYLKQTGKADEIAQRFRGLYKLLSAKYYVDEIYNALFVRPIHRLSESFLWKVFDVKIIDGLVNGLPQTFLAAANILRRWQTGIVQNYAVSLLIGAIVVLGYLLMR